MRKLLLFKSFCRTPLLVLFSVLITFVVQAQTFTSTTTGGDWNIGTTWVGGVVPGANAEVIINGAVTIPINVTPSIKNLTVNDGKTLTLGNSDLPVSGIVNLVGSGTINSAAKTIAYGASGELIYSGTTPKVTGVEWPVKAEMSRVTILNTGGVTLNEAKTLSATKPKVINVQLVIGDGTTPAVFNDGGFQITSTGTLQLLSGTFRLGNTTMATVFPAFSSMTINPGTTIEYTSGVAQTVAALPNYANLKISGSGVKTLAGNVTLSGDLTVAGGVLDLVTFSASRSTAGGTLTVANSATLQVGGAANFPANFLTNALAPLSQVDYNGGDQTITSAPYGNLQLRGNGTKTLPAITISGNLTTLGTLTALAAGSLTIGNSLTVGAGTTFNAGAYTHIIGGNWTVLGNFNEGASNIEFRAAGDVEVSQGRFNNVVFGARTVTATGNLTISGAVTITGNFTAGSYTHTIQGNWTNNGILTAGTSTVVFSGSNPQTIGGTAASSFNNVTVANAAGVALAQNSTISGTLTFAAGGIDVGAGFTATVQHLDAGTYQLAGDGAYVLPAGGSITTANPSGVDGGTIAVSGARTYAATGASFTFKAATVNPFPAAVTGVNNLTLEANVTLNQNMDVAGTVTLTSGQLTVPAGRELRLAGANAIAGAPFGTAKHIVTAVDPTDGTKGFVRVNGLTAAYTVPVGNGTHYLPVTLTPEAAASNDFAVCVFPGLTANGEPNGAPFTADQKLGAVDAVWMVNRLAGSGAVGMTVSWPAALEGTLFQGFANTSIGIAHYGTAWETAVGAGDNTANTASRTGITDFSPFGVFQVPVVTLPVRFTSFVATRQNEAVDLQWETAQEENNRGFTVQRKTDGVWQNIAVVPSKAPGGNSSQPLAYAYKDLNTYGGISQYRILQTDIDGKYSFSDVRAVRGIRQAAAVVAYPNPSTGGTVNLLLGAATQSGVRVLDGQGRLVREYRHVGSNHLVIDRLGSGLYTMQVTDRSTGEVSVVRVLVQ